MVIRKIPTGDNNSDPPPQRNVSSAKLVLTSPAPADRSRLSLPVNKVTLQSEPEPDDDDCKKVAEELQRALEMAIQTFNKVPKEKKQSQLLKDSLISAQSTLNDTLGSSGPSANLDKVVLDTARQTAQQTAHELSDQLLDILKSRIDQALQ